VDEKTTSKDDLNRLLAEHYDNAAHAKEQGKLVAWCTSISPQELLETMGVLAVYPENHAAAIGARKQSQDFINYAESKGYSNDICSYARVNLAYMELLQSEAANIPRPDFIFACNNICNTVLKWYENIAKELGVPIIVFDTPFNFEYEVSPQNTAYIKGQLLEAIAKLEDITKKKFDYDKFREVMKISSETSVWWKKASLEARAKPSPLNGFDLFNYMAAIVCMRGTVEGRDLYKKWAEELAEAARAGKGPWEDQTENFRVMWDGIAVWPFLGATYKTLKKYGVNMVTSTYPDSWNIVYDADDLDGMARCYSSNYVNRNLDFGVNAIVKNVEDFSLDGIVYHSNRSCKLMDFRQFETQRRVEERTGVPSVMFDGDQTDPRVFNVAQFENKVQALVEMMTARKEGAK